MNNSEDKKRLDQAREFLMRITKTTSITVAKSLAREGLLKTSKKPWMFKISDTEADVIIASRLDGENNA